MANGNQNSKIEDIKQRLKDISPPDICGFLILFDIKDSTVRKQRLQLKWYHQTELIYSLFSEFVENLGIEAGLEKLVLKYIGDGLMAFLEFRPDQEKPLSDVTKMVFDMATQFVLEKVYDDNAEALDNMRFKSVFSYVKAHPVSYSDDRDSKKDVIGNDIDLAFRLEKFADDTHFIINAAFAEQLGDKNQTYCVRKNVFNFVRCAKKVKGFEALQEFYALCDIHHLQNTVAYKEYSASREDITEELLNFVAGRIGGNGDSSSPFSAAFEKTTSS